MCSIGSTRRKSREVARSTNRGSIPGIAVAAVNIGALALLVPIGILFLVFAAAIRVMLRTRNRQLRANPKSSFWETGKGSVGGRLCKNDRFARVSCRKS